MSRSTLWVGRVLSALPVALMVFSAILKFRAPPEVLQTFTAKYGYPPQSLAIIGVLELACVVVYVVPQTAVLGAVLIAAYLGGAVSTRQLTALRICLSSPAGSLMSAFVSASLTRARKIL